jgi:hypothetical protein
VNWVVVTRASYEAWEATTDPWADAEIRIAVLTWVLGLQRGPPAGGTFDSHSGIWSAPVGDTGVAVEYVVLRDLEPPAIVIKRYT